MDSVLPLGIIAAVRPEGLSILGWRFWLWASQTLARVGGVVVVVALLLVPGVFWFG